MTWQRVFKNEDVEGFNWESDDSVLFNNPNAPMELQRNLKLVLDQIDSVSSQIWLMSSGTQGQQKLVGVAKSQFLQAATDLSKQFDFKPNETWLNTLPVYHVGGLSIYARAQVVGQKVIVQKKWSAPEFLKLATEQKVQWSSLVPTQVYDLCHQSLNSPKDLRGVFVGGGALSTELYVKARELGWPLLPTYGMTEASSQIATATLESLNLNAYPELTVRPGLRVKTNEAQTLAISGSGVLTSLAYFSDGYWEQIDPLDSEGFYWTSDSVQINPNGSVEVLGRSDDLVKIKGELVSLQKLQHKLEALTYEKGESHSSLIVLRPDSRDSFQVCLVSELSGDVAVALARQYNEHGFHHEKIRWVFGSMRIERTELGKPRRDKLNQWIQESTGISVS